MKVHKRRKETLGGESHQLEVRRKTSLIRLVAYRARRIVVSEPPTKARPCTNTKSLDLLAWRNYQSANDIDVGFKR
jgi:hypothetical protein